MFLKATIRSLVIVMLFGLAPVLLDDQLLVLYIPLNLTYKSKKQTTVARLSAKAKYGIKTHGVC